ncbi:MAG: monodechloroaminopyrrolnitrin synthase PrnB family protein [Fulvivirga sp.]
MIKTNLHRFWEGQLKRQHLEDLKIANADPLGVDEIIQWVPKLNQGNNVGQLIRDLYRSLPVPKKLAKFNYYESQAAMRDIGIYLGSIRKYGLEPVSEVPELDFVLGELSEKTDMPPRDTLLHYTIWNPAGRRLRTYTKYEEERELINSVKISFNPLMEAIHRLIDLYWTSPYSSDFVFLCKELETVFKNVIAGIVHAKRTVPPELFANELRFYFEPISIYNQDLIGPGAVEMPLFVYDYILWGADVKNDKYQIFAKTYLKFNLPQTRDIFYNFAEKNSLVSNMVLELNKPDLNPTVLASAKALISLCNQEKSFRIPHKRLAEQSYKHQKGPEAKEVGSGGYSTSILNDILTVNIQQIDRLKRSVDRILN